MKLALALASLLCAVIFAAGLFRVAESQKINETPRETNFRVDEKSPVLVELYTSEGCSSCPPAEAALAFLEREQPYAEAEIITLALHVDYWNRLGWSDKFSSPLYSQRQAVYAQRLKLNSAFTPQMIVDGRFQFVGSNASDAAKAIVSATRAPKANIEMSYEKNNGRSLKIEISKMPKHGDSTVFLAVAEDGLSSNVQRGENAGKTLEHASVVRKLKTIGKIEARRNEFSASFALSLNPEWTAKNIKFVVFIQENDSRKIHGAARIAAE